VKRYKELFEDKRAHPLFVSEALYNRVKVKGAIPDKKRILHCGIDTSQFSRQNQQSNGKVFLQVSSFVGKKGHSYTLKAFSQFLSRVTNPEAYKLILAGGGVYHKKMKELAKKLNLTEQVEFPGWVTHDEGKALMEKADFFVHHSVTLKNGDQEGIPTAIMEAMAMELPVISTYHSGIPELVEDGVNGYLVKERDVDTYAQRMQDILSWGYKSENRAKIQDLFEWRQHAEQLIGFYKDALQ